MPASERINKNIKLRDDIVVVERDSINMGDVYDLPSNIALKRRFFFYLLRREKLAPRLSSRDGILRRDIEVDDIGYCREDANLVDILMDFVLACMEMSRQTKTCLLSGRETLLAREMLRLHSDYMRKFHHGLESLLCVLLRHTLGYTHPQLPVLREWIKGSWDDIRKEKRLLVSNTGVEVFPDDNTDELYFRTLCRSLSLASSAISHALGPPGLLQSPTKSLYLKDQALTQSELNIYYEERKTIFLRRVSIVDDAERPHNFIKETRKIKLNRIIPVLAWKNDADIPQTKQLVEKCTSKPKEVHEEKKLRTLLERKYKPISEITEPEKFWLAFLQCVKFTHRLCSRGDILHRDININNSGYCVDENDEEVGALVDFDLASLNEIQKSRSRSGTAPFMAREVLDFQKPYMHKFQHELESLLYVLTWHTLGYSTGRGKFPSEVLDGWRKGSWETILGAKNNFINEEWRVTFPDTESSAGYLHIRCRPLCALYSRVYSMLTTSEANTAISKLPFKKRRRPPLGPVNTKRVVTYQEWLEIVDEDDDELCNKDCCVELI